MQAKPNNKAAGGIARAAALTSEQRSDIARKGALKRSGIPSATHSGSIRIAGAEIPCAVLEDGRRVVWQREVVGMLTGNKKGGLSRYLSASNLLPYAPTKFVDKDFDQSAISFEMDGRKGHGFEGDDIVDICSMYLDARKAGVLLSNQTHLASQAEIIVKSLAKVGIAALIDEATGYQEVRDRKALAALLDKYLLQEFAKWAKRFPDNFYREMFRLRGWTYPSVSGGKPGVVGKYTMDIVYQRLSPGLVKELEQRNPKEDSGRRKSKHHQWLTDDVGHPALSEHLHAVTGLMRACDEWDQFRRMLDRSFPIKGDQLRLKFDD